MKKADLTKELKAAKKQLKYADENHVINFKEIRELKKELKETEEEFRKAMVDLMKRDEQYYQLQKEYAMLSDVADVEMPFFHTFETDELFGILENNIKNDKESRMFLNEIKHRFDNPNKLYTFLGDIQSH